VGGGWAEETGTSGGSFSHRRERACRLLEHPKQVHCCLQMLLPPCRPIGRGATRLSLLVEGSARPDLRLRWLAGARDVILVVWYLWVNSPGVDAIRSRRVSPTIAPASIYSSSRNDLSALQGIGMMHSEPMPAARAQPSSQRLKAESVLTKRSECTTVVRSMDHDHAAKCAARTAPAAPKRGILRNHLEISSGEARRMSLTKPGTWNTAVSVSLQATRITGGVEDSRLNQTLRYDIAQHGYSKKESRP